MRSTPPAVPSKQASFRRIVERTGVVVGGAAVGIGGAASCFCVDPLPPPSDSAVVDPPPPPSDSAVDAGTDGGMDAGTDSSVVDPPPPPLDSGTDASALAPTPLLEAPGGDPLPLDPSFRVIVQHEGRGEGGLVTLRAATRHAGSSTVYAWSVSGGRLADGATPELAHWLPPAEPGRYLVQVVALRGDRAAAVGALELDV